MPRSLAETAAKLSAALHGCRCEPHLRARHDHDGEHISISHDDDCPAVTASPGVAFFDGQHLLVWR
jgi:hypothetical protein